MCLKKFLFIIFFTTFTAADAFSMKSVYEVRLLNVAHISDIANNNLM